MTIGERIKELRQEKGYTLKQVAESVGVSEATMQRYEAGKIKNISPDMVGKLAVALGTTGSWLLGEHEKDLANKDGVFQISITEKILISIYRSLTEAERDSIREIMLSLNNQHSLSNRLKFELDAAEDFLDNTGFSNAYTIYKNKLLDETSLSKIDPTMAIHAEIYDAMRLVDTDKATEYAQSVTPNYNNVKVDEK